jgi:hypothetical protein
MKQEHTYKHTFSRRSIILGVLLLRFSFFLSHAPTRKPTTPTLSLLP